MIPASFDYVRPGSVEEALAVLAANEDAKVLAGGHSLIPALKFRLAQPKLLVDLGGIADLRGIREEAGRIVIGAMTTHYEIESSLILAGRCPLLPEVAARIGDVQVRNRGTIGGSLTHADPGGDWPAAILALAVELEIAGASGRRQVPAAEFFLGFMQTAVQPGEILCAIRVLPTARSVAYVKFAQKASGFALVGAAVVVHGRRGARVGITGVAAVPYRAAAVERALADRHRDALAEAAARAADGIEPLSDIHASAEFRAHLAQVATRQALERALDRA